MKNYIVLIVLGYLIVAGGGFFAGKKWGNEPPPPMDTSILDSIVMANAKLEDSLTVERKRYDENAKQVIVYRDRYHTITITENTDSLVRGLQIIANTPPQ